MPELLDKVDDKKMGFMPAVELSYIKPKNQRTAFKNPLAGPSILGINAGASLGVAFVMLLFGGSITAGAVSYTHLDVYKRQAVSSEE